MNYINKSVNVFDSEPEFLKALAFELNSADPRIVCETNIDNEFISESSYKPIISFNINNSFKINFKRSAGLGSSNSKYGITYIINGVESDQITDLTYSQGISGYNKISTKCYKFSVVYNNNFILINFANYNQIIPQQIKFSMFTYHTDEYNLVSAISDTTIPASQANLVRTDSGNVGKLYQFANRLDYSLNENNIEIINTKVIKSSDDLEMVIDDIIDCSNVTQNSIISIDDKKYYSIDSHTLALIDDNSQNIEQDTQ